MLKIFMIYWRTNFVFIFLVTIIYEKFLWNCPFFCKQVAKIAELLLALW